MSWEEWQHRLESAAADEPVQTTKAPRNEQEALQRLSDYLKEIADQARDGTLCDRIKVSSTALSNRNSRASRPLADK